MNTGGSVIAKIKSIGKTLKQMQIFTTNITKSALKQRLGTHTKMTLLFAPCI